MTKLLKAALLAGVAVHLWTTLSWMVLPFHKMTIKSFDEDTAVQLALLKGISSNKAAVYALPAMHSGKSNGGPAAFIALTPKGQVFSWKKIAFDVVNNIIVAFLIGILLMMVNIAGYFNKVKFVTLLGFTAGIMSYLPNWNWWGFATDYTAVAIADLTISGLILGLVLAKFTEK